MAGGSAPLYYTYIKEVKSELYDKHSLQRRLVLAAISVLLAFAVVSVATFAWYIYNTSAHTTKVHLAAGAGGGLLINDKFAESNGHTYSFNAGMAHTGILNPVSTNDITKGFRKVYGFTDGSDVKSKLANLFGKVESADYYVTSLYFKTDGGEPLNLFLGHVKYTDDSNENPISTAIRMGFVVYPAGTDPDEHTVIPGCEQYILAINPTGHMSDPYYNTGTGDENGDYALDSAHFADVTMTADVPTVQMMPFTGTHGPNILYTNSNYYFSEPRPAANLPDNRTPNPNPLQLGGNSILQADGTPTRIDVYVWLEGCDVDCTLNIVKSNLNNVELEFVSEPAD